MNKILIQKYSLILADILAVMICYYLATQIANYLRGDDYHQINLHHMPILKILDLLILLSLMWQKQIYFKRRPNWEELRITYRALVTVFLINMPVLFMKSSQPGLLKLFLLFWFGLFIIIPTLRVIAKLILSNLNLWQRNVYIVGVNENALAAYNLLSPSTLLGYRIKAFVDIKHQTREFQISDNKALPVIFIPELFTMPNRSEIIICLDSKSLAKHNKLINQLQQKFLSVSILPELEGLPLYGIEVNHFFGSEQLLLRLENNLSSRFNRAVKYTFDLFISILLSPVLFVLILFISFLIYLEDKGGPFFIQERIGHAGVKFKCFKFRTMHKNAEEMLINWCESNSPLYQQYVMNNFKLANDPRITRVGKFLRKTSLDELPQLLNVFMSQMSLVGPRPLLERELNDYHDAQFYYNQVRPGITGLWQISGRSKTSFKDRARLDTWYVKNWTLWYDIVILIKTFIAVLKREGAY